MKITAIKQQVKSPDRVSVFVDGKYEFSLSLDELVKYKLRNGQEMTPAELKKFKKVSADGKLRARALEWLINRPHSERELRDYLYRKKTEPEQIDGLVEEFTGKGYLDNAKFAAWFTELQARRGKSDRAIRAGLFKKGIGRELADETLAGASGQETKRLKELVEKKRNLSRYKNDPDKLKRYLVGQGFAWQDIKQALADQSAEH